MKLRSLFSITPAPDAKVHVLSCYHCGLNMPKQVRHYLVIEGVQQPMCCVGCLTAAEFLQDVDTRFSRQG